MKTILLTGAGGFIGRAAWDYFLSRDYHVVGIDSLVRPGSYAPPRHEHGEFFLADINDIGTLPLPRPFAVIHLAAQASVTRAVTSPHADFRANAAGSFAVLDWTRTHAPDARVLYASTNKVLGDLPHRSTPVADDQPLAPVTPYGISKAIGDLYTREFFPDTGYVFRQSCIYGETQTGSEDQGWVAHLARRLLRNQPVTIFGTGGQVRDLLHISSLLLAYEFAVLGVLPPAAYVIGGGVENAVSVWEVVDIFSGPSPRVGHAAQRPHDQDYFVSANTGLGAHGWTAGIPFASRIAALCAAWKGGDASAT